MKFGDPRLKCLLKPARGTVDSRTTADLGSA